eukprot:6426025-Ditylum_brightwellii.AAC.1
MRCHCIHSFVYVRPFRSFLESDEFLISPPPGNGTNTRTSTLVEASLLWKANNKTLRDSQPKSVGLWPTYITEQTHNAKAKGNE